jgi:hypothetical protein
MVAPDDEDQGLRLFLVKCGIEHIADALSDALGVLFTGVAKKRPLVRLNHNHRVFSAYATAAHASITAESTSFLMPAPD